MTNKEEFNNIPKKVLEAHNTFPLKNKATLVSANEGGSLNVHFSDNGIADQYKKHIESQGLFSNHKKTSHQKHTFKVYTSNIEKNDQEMTQKLVGDLLDDNSKAQVDMDQRDINKNEYLDEKQVASAIIQKATEILDEYLAKAKIDEGLPIKDKVEMRSGRNDREAAGFGLPHPKDGRIGSDEISVKFVGNPKTAKLRSFMDKVSEKRK